MTQSLSAEELAALKKRIEDYPPSMTQSHWTQRELPALLAMASRLVELEPHIEHGRKLLLEIGGDSEECWQQNDRTFENAAPLADALARVVGYPAAQRGR